MFFVVTQPNSIPFAVKSIAEGKTYAQSYSDIRKFLASDLAKNYKYINERQSEAAGIPDFYNVTVQLTNLPTYISVDDINDIIARWAKKSRITLARGDRVSVVSQAAQGDILRDSLTYEIALGTAVVYNHRRATLNHSRDAAEFFEDKAWLMNKLSKLDYSIDAEVAHEKFAPASLPAVTGLHATPCLPAPTTILAPVANRLIDRAIDHLKAQQKATGNGNVILGDTYRNICRSLGIGTGTPEYKRLNKQLRKHNQVVTSGYGRYAFA
jgi:hypothetical protein